jgi:hypothetical protein
VLPLYLCAHGIVGWIFAGLELTGAQGAQVEHTACVHRGDARCTYAIRWS